jgi:anti-sigma B factor antagonist
MEIASVRKDDVTVVTIKHDLDASTAAETTAYLSAEIDAGHARLAIDLSGVAYLSSAGLRVILIALRSARSSGGDLRLAGATGDIRRILEVSGVAKLTRTFHTAEEAVASFRPGG